MLPMSDSNPGLVRDLLKLAIPTLGALVIEPVLSLCDSALVGHLGATQLAGLGLGATITQTLVGLCVFLAYSTTALTGQAFGAGDYQKGLRLGVQGLWLAGLVGMFCTLILTFLVDPIIACFHPNLLVFEQAKYYIWGCAPGMVAMMVVLSAIGVLRGLLDTKTPLRVTVFGALINIPLSFLFIYGFDWGVAGAGIGTSMAQILMAMALVWFLFRQVKFYEQVHGFSLSWSPSFSTIKYAGQTGFPLVIRSLFLQFSGLVTVAAATHFGVVALAAHQIVMTLWRLSAFALDAIAIAAQALVAQQIGREGSTVCEIRQLIYRVNRVALLTGVFTGLVFLFGAPFWPMLFSTQASVLSFATFALIPAGLAQPLAALVFAYDGYLLGCRDNRFLAFGLGITFACYAPLVFGGIWYGNFDPWFGLVLLWVAYGFVFIGVRYLTLRYRVAHSSNWFMVSE